MDDLEVYHDTAVFGPHRWAIRGSDNRIIAGAQFTSQHDAETALKVAAAIADLAREALIDRMRTWTTLRKC